VAAVHEAVQHGQHVLGRANELILHLLKRIESYRGPLACDHYRCAGGYADAVRRRTSRLIVRSIAKLTPSGRPLRMSLAGQGDAAAGEALPVRDCLRLQLYHQYDTPYDSE
jgi:hypothetical protein